MSKRSSITCPKCERVSHHPGDIQHHYCSKCGYHDSLHVTKLGVPGVSAKFRQPTPSMALQALLSSFGGTFDNWVEGITSDVDLRVAFERFRDDVIELNEHLASGEWVQPRIGPEPPAGGGIL